MTNVIIPNKIKLQAPPCIDFYYYYRSLVKLVGAILKFIKI
jgi:hypothetical protein